MKFIVLERCSGSSGTAMSVGDCHMNRLNRINAEWPCLLHSVHDSHSAQKEEKRNNCYRSNTALPGFTALYGQPHVCCAVYYGGAKVSL